MKICVISTTINVPSVFELYRALGPDVDIIVTGDQKTPHAEAAHVIESLGGRYLDVRAQEELNTTCSPIIGWNTIRRRNLALLEAIRSKPDVIVTVDDDNIPVSPDYFETFRKAFAQPFSGVSVRSKLNWFDAGILLTPPSPHRGFPYSKRHRDLQLTFGHVTGARIGVAAGLWLGDPDIDAATRIVNAPQILGFSELARHGLSVEPGCFTPFNSQNTAFRAELAPLMAVWIDVGRYDDIWAAYVAQRIMMETGDCVMFGPPYVWQERNAHNLMRDLKDEIYGMESTDRFVQDLLDMDLGSGSVLDKMRRLYGHLQTKEYIPESMRRFGLTWCDDVERALQ
jgi:hypothetical protein